MAVTALTQLATLVTWLCCGPRSAWTGPAIARGSAMAAGVLVGLRLASLFQLCTNARLRSALAASIETPGFRRARTCIQPQL
jgi:hypothetical protein